MSLNRTAVGGGWGRMLGCGDETSNDKEIKWRNNLKMSCGGGVRYETWVQTKQAATVLTQKDAGVCFVKVVILYIWSLVQSFLPFHFVLGDACLVIMSTGKEWTNPSSFIPVLRIKTSRLHIFAWKRFTTERFSTVGSLGETNDDVYVLNNATYKPPAISLFRFLRRLIVSI